MALIEFKDLPDTTTPLTASNLNANFDYLDTHKLENVPINSGRYIKSIGVDYYDNKWCLKVILVLDGTEYTQYYYSDAGNLL